MATPAKRKATYQDVLDAPEHVVAEIIDGDLYLSPRPAGPYTVAASALGYLLGPPFQFGSGGPGGWIILVEPELHLGDDIVVPDLAAWRSERLPQVGDIAYFTIPPDWICEVLSPSTEGIDRAEKLRIYAAAGVAYAWLVNARQQTIEVMRVERGNWLTTAVHRGDKQVRAEPFDAAELDLARLWERIAPLPPRRSRASEAGAEYDY